MPSDKEIGQQQHLLPWTDQEQNMREAFRQPVDHNFPGCLAQTALASGLAATATLAVSVSAPEKETKHMSDTKKNDTGAHQEWCRQFAQKAIQRAASEIRPLKVERDAIPLFVKQRMADAALEIGWMIVSEIRGLVSENTVQASRDNIIGGLSDIMQHSYPGGSPHLGHDIVDEVCVALGEKPDRSKSTYD